MNVSKVFNYTAYTNNGNKYEKTRGGKIAGAAGATLVSGVRIAKEAAKGGFKGLPFVSTAMILALSTAIGAAVWTGVGAIPDAVVNSSRRNKADRAAFEKKHA